MKQFIFKLQTALDIKTKEEDRQKEKLNDLTGVYKLNLNKLNTLRNKLLDIQDVLRDTQSHQMDIVKIKSCQEFIPVLNEQINHQESITEHSRQKMEKARCELLEIMKERKVLEKLRARHYQEYLKECLREEQIEIDEMATVRFVYRDSVV